MNHHITPLEDSRLITDFEGSWGSLLMFAVKPHKEDCSNINALFRGYELAIDFELLLIVILNILSLVVLIVLRTLVTPVAHCR